MPGSDQRLSTKTGLIKGSIVAAAMCSVIIGWGLLQSANYGREADNYRAEYAEYTNEKVTQACVGIATGERLKCVDEAFEAKREYEANQYDLEAQRKSALWAYIMGATAVVGMALSAVGVWLVKTTFEETRAGNVIARDAQRAWITLETEPILIRSRPEGGLYIRVNFTAKNVGQTAATDFEFVHSIIFHGDKERDESVDRRCVAQVEKWVTEIGDMSDSTLPPGAIEFSSIWQQYSARVINWFAQEPAGKESTEITLLSAVFYRTTSHPDQLQCSWRTWFLCTVSREGETVLRVPKQRDFTAASLRVEPFRTALVHSQRTANDGNRHRS